MSLDLASDKLDVGRALKVAKKWWAVQVGGAVSNPLDPFSSLLGYACRSFNKDRKDAMEIVALATTFSESPIHFPNAARKVLQYHRLCLSWTRADMRPAAEKNVQKLIAKLGE